MNVVGSPQLIAVSRDEPANYVRGTQMSLTVVYPASYVNRKTAHTEKCSSLVSIYLAEAANSYVKPPALPVRIHKALPFPA